MNTKGSLLLFVMFFVGLVTMNGQTKQGCIVSIEGSTVYVDLTKPQVQVGDRLEVVVSGGYMTHPVTGRRVRKEDQVLGRLEIKATYAEYSTARLVDSSILSQLKPKMSVRKVRQMEVARQTPVRASDTPSSRNTTSSRNDAMHNAFVSSGSQSSSTSSTPTSNFNPSWQRNNFSSDKVSIVIAPAQVNDVVNNGHFGGYVADILMEQMLMCDKVRLLDRSVLNAQIDEINLAGDILDPSTTIQRGKVVGARYILQTTMQKPDVANIQTGIPLASVMGAVQGITGTNIGAAYASNVQIAKLKASVSISVRVVDLQTGEVVFMCSGSGTSQGKSQLSLEYGALGGGQLNGGAQDFKQTVTGKAIQQAFRKIGRNLNDFFNGNADRKVMGSVSGGYSSNERMYAKGFKLYLGTQRIAKDEVPSVLSEHHNLYFQYRSALKKKKQSWWVSIGGSLASFGIAVLLAGNDDSANTAYAIWGGGTIASVIGGICLNASGRKTIKRIVNTYNQSNTRYSYTEQDPYKYSLSFSPTGIRFTF